jgi:hypothetical protein
MAPHAGELQPKLQPGTAASQTRALVLARAAEQTRPVVAALA